MAKAETKNYGTPERPFYKEDVIGFRMMLGDFIQAPEITDGFSGIFGERMGRGISQILYSFMLDSVTERVIKTYHAGGISPGLTRLLEMDIPIWDAGFPIEAGGVYKSWQGQINNLIREGKADFSSFKGPQDQGENWLIRYVTAPYIFTSFLQGNIWDIEKAHQESKKKARAILLGNLAAAFDETDPQKYRRPPMNDSALSAYLTSLKRVYERKAGENASLNFYKIILTDFYMNPETGAIFDLRPYKEEISLLLAPMSWDYILEYSRVIRGYLKGRRAALTARQKKDARKRGIFDKAFIKMFNAAPTNDLVNINATVSGRQATEDGYFEQNIFTSEWEYKRGGTELNLPVKTLDGHVLPPAFSTSTWKTMHFLSLLFSAQNSRHGSQTAPVIETSVREYMAATGRNVTPNTVKETTKALKRDLELLNEIKIKYNDKKYSLNQVRPFPGVHLNRGNIRVTLDSDFAVYLSKTTGFLMNYPAALLKLKENNSNLYPLGYKMALNRSNDNNIRKGKANILSVPVLLESCPGIPPIEKVRKEGKGGSPVRRIIEPFEKTLDALQEQGVLDHWEYCLPKGEPLKLAAVTDYKYFVSLYVSYEIKNFPIKDELPRIQATAEKRRKRAERIDRLTDNIVAKKRAKKIE